jgi:hypothetical protein
MSINAKRVIWTNDNLDYKDWKSDLESEYPELNDDERYEKMLDINAEYLNDERANLSIELLHPILVIATLGLWNGPSVAVKKLGNNIKDCLYSDCDYVTWYIDENDDFCCEAKHHDGTNHYTYRMLVSDDDSDEIFEQFAERIYNNESIEDLVQQYTKPIGDKII